MYQWSHPAQLLQGTRSAAQWPRPVTNLVDGMDRAKPGHAVEGPDDLYQVLALATYLDGGSDALPCKQHILCYVTHNRNCTGTAHKQQHSRLGAEALQTVYLVEGLYRLAGGSRSAGRSRKAISCSLHTKWVTKHML